MSTAAKRGTEEASHMNWLHGDSGTPCLTCDSHIRPRDRVRTWDDDTKQYVMRDREVCQSCEDEANRERARTNGSTSPSAQSLSLLARTFPALAAADGARFGALYTRTPPRLPR